MENKKIWTIPNILSMSRIVLAFIIMFIYLFIDFDNKTIVIASLIVLSALTDFIDGQIARRFNMISEIGKILDPFADKLTQLILLICLIIKNKWIILIFGLFIGRELAISIFAFLAVKKEKKNQGAKIYGKVNTAYFYISMLLIFLFPYMKWYYLVILAVSCTLCMTITFILYIRHYTKIIRNKRTTL